MGEETKVAPDVIPFDQFVAHAQEGKTAAAEGNNDGFGKRQTGPMPAEENSVAPTRDRGLASAVTQAIAQLQGAMDSAIQAGLIIEPSFKTVSGRLNEFGVSVDSHLCSVQIYRKLV